MRKFYTVVAFLIVATYAWADFTGREFTETRRGVSPQGLRGTRGGSTSFWYSGYHGGK
ncbi:MAG TPA: hypothetical protein VMU84_01430 [Thermoanaerobaculia bacterium]|nr:hypothetical protein [Thermoanaerobaculia bacterium]